MMGARVSDSVEGILRDLQQEGEKQSGRSMHMARMEPALLSLRDMTHGDGERALHALTRLGVWASEAAVSLERGEIASDDLVKQLRYLGRAGHLIFANT